MVWPAKSDSSKRDESSEGNIQAGEPNKCYSNTTDESYDEMNKRDALVDIALENPASLEGPAIQIRKTKLIQMPAFQEAV